MELEIENTRKVKFSDYVYVLYRWRKFLIINLFLIAAIATAASFMIAPKYKATATIMIPPESSMGLGGLTGLLSNKGAASLGSKLFGVSNSSEDVLMAILNSRTALTKVINDFNLMKYYEIDDNNMDKALKAFSADLSFNPNEFGMIDISVINKDPKVSANIANYFTRILDSLNIKINVEQAKNNRMFIEQRYLKNLSDLKESEDSLYRFQKKYGVFAVPQQMEVAVKAAAEIESQLAQKDMSSFFIKQQYGENSPQYQGIMTEVKLLKAKVDELKRADKLSQESNVLFPFKEFPDLSIQYLRNYRNVEIQNKILEVVLPLFEQAKVEEQKSIPTIALLDKAVPPKLKDSPKKAFIIAGAFFISLFIFSIFVFMFDGAIRRIEWDNPIQEKMTRFSRRIMKFYRIKI